MRRFAVLGALLVALLLPTGAPAAGDELAAASGDGCAGPLETPLGKPVAACGLTVVSGVGLAAQPVACVEVPGVNDRPCPDFEATHDAAHAQLPLDVVVVGDLLVSALWSFDEDLATDWVVLAVDRDTGEQAWVLEHATDGDDRPVGVLASPDGSVVYAAGRVDGGTDPARGDVEVLAIETASGEALWAHRYGNPTGGLDNPAAVALSADGATLYVGGTSPRPGEQVGFVLAVDTDDGARRFVQVLDGPAGYDWVADVAAVPAGVAVLLHHGSGSGYDALTVVLDDAGREVWRDRYDGGLFEYPAALATAPDGATVYVSTESYDPYLAFGLIQPYRVATVAYDAATGARRWAHRSAGVDPLLPERFMTPTGLTVAADGTVVQIHQQCDVSIVVCAWGTTAFDPSGRVLWERRYDHPAKPFEVPLAVAAAPDASVVYVTGVSADAPGSVSLVHSDTVTGGTGVTFGTAVTGEGVTVAYDLATGQPAWTARFNSSPTFTDYGFTRALAVPGDMVYAAHTAYRGPSTTGANLADAVLIGYRP